MLVLISPSYKDTSRIELGPTYDLILLNYILKSLSSKYSHWGASTLTCELRRGQNPVHNTPFGTVTGSRMASIPVRVHEMQGNVYSDFWERGVSFPPLDLVVFRYETCSSCSHSYAMRKANSNMKPLHRGRQNKRFKETIHKYKV